MLFIGNDNIIIRSALKDWLSLYVRTLSAYSRVDTKVSHGVYEESAVHEDH